MEKMLPLSIVMALCKVQQNETDIKEAVHRQLQTADLDAVAAMPSSRHNYIQDMLHAHEDY